MHFFSFKNLYCFIRNLTGADTREWIRVTSSNGCILELDGQRRKMFDFAGVKIAPGESYAAFARRLAGATRLLKFKVMKCFKDEVERKWIWRIGGDRLDRAILDKIRTRIHLSKLLFDTMIQIKTEPEGELDSVETEENGLKSRENWDGCPEGNIEGPSRLQDDKY